MEAQLDQVIGSHSWNRTLRDDDLHSFISKRMQVVDAQDDEMFDDDAFNLANVEE